MSSAAVVIGTLSVKYWLCAISNSVNRCFSLWIVLCVCVEGLYLMNSVLDLFCYFSKSYIPCHISQRLTCIGIRYISSGGSF